MEILFSFLGIDNLDQLIVAIAMMGYVVLSSGFLISVLAYAYLQNRKERAIDKEIIRKYSIDQSSSSEKRRSGLLNPRMRVVNLGAPLNILSKNASNSVNSTDSQPFVASIDLLDKDQNALILLCCWKATRE